MCSDNFLNKTSDGNTENQEEDENQLDEIKEDNIEAARKHAESKDTATGATKKLINDQQHDCFFIVSFWILNRLWFLFLHNLQLPLVH
jgi:hypothetical protein